MKSMKQWWMMGAVCALIAASGSLMAQDRGGRGNFDPAQFQQRRMDNLKEQLEVKDDAEWKAIQPLIEKVFDAQRSSMADRARGMFMGGRRPGGDRGPGGSGTDNNSGGGGERRGGISSFLGTPSPEVETLQKAVDGKASKEDLKTALAKVQEARKKKQEELEKAQGELRKVLSLRQEAIATLNGLL